MTHQTVAAVFGAVALIACCTGAVQAEAQPAEYVLRVGDAIEVSIPSFQIQRKVTIGPDGRVTVPIAGEFPAEGRTLPELSKTLKEAITGKSLTYRSNDGRELTSVISPEEISVFVAEYRPIYISGDVSKPGEFTFRPGMIVQQAIANAGGYDLVHFRLDNPFVSAIGYNSDYVSAWTDVLRNRTRVAHIQRLLGSKDTIAEERGGPYNPLPSDAQARIRKAQIDEIDAKMAEFTAKTSAAQDQLNRADARLKTLLTQQETERQAAQLDAAEEQRITELVQRGTAAITRAADARRLSLLSATRVLQVEAQAEQTRKDMSEVRASLRTNQQESVTALQERLQDATIQLAKSLAARQAVWEKMVYVGRFKSQIAGSETSNVALTINRQDGARDRKAMEASDNTELQPGDVILVKLKLQQNGDN